MKLSILIPVYNEKNMVEKAMSQIAACDPGIEKELVLIDDGSTDGTVEILKRLQNDNPEWKVLFHEKNRGKGAALRTGIEAATGDLVVIQDADMEYDPAEFPMLLAPILQGRADVVYGSRFLGGGAHRVCFFWHYQGNRLITLLSNMMTNLNLTDVEVCYKVFKKEVLDSISLVEDRFGFEIEVTAKVARNSKWRIYEVPISYYGRSYAEGKKIGWQDGFRALWCILKYHFV